MDLGPWIAGTAAAGGWIVWAIWHRRKARQRRSLFSVRPEPEFTQWFENYYRESGLDPYLVKCVLDELAETIGVSPTQLLPTDAIDKELSYGLKHLHLDDPLEEFYERMHDRAIDCGLREWYIPKGVKTLDDVIRVFALDVDQARFAQGERSTE